MNQLLNTQELLFKTKIIVSYPLVPVKLPNTCIELLI